MKFPLSIVMYVFTLESFSLETTKEAPKEVTSQNISYKISLNDYQPTPTPWDPKRDMKSLWVYRPPSLSQGVDEDVRTAIFRVPHLLTRLAKPFSYGVDPYFSKDNFEPFESSSFKWPVSRRPVTLIAFRKNGLIPRRSVRQSESAEIAELQSPFNEIGNLWQDEPGVFNL